MNRSDHANEEGTTVKRKSTRRPAMLQRCNYCGAMSSHLGSAGISLVRKDGTRWWPAICDECGRRGVYADVRRNRLVSPEEGFGEADALAAYRAAARGDYRALERDEGSCLN